MDEGEYASSLKKLATAYRSSNCTFEMQPSLVSEFICKPQLPLDVNVIKRDVDEGYFNPVMHNDAAGLCGDINESNDPENISKFDLQCIDKSRVLNSSGEQSYNSLERTRVDTVALWNEDRSILATINRWSRTPFQASSLLDFVLALIIVGGILLCLVASKLTCILVAQSLNRLKPSEKQLIDALHYKKHQFLCGKVLTNGSHYQSFELPEFCYREVTFLMLCIILMAPPASTILKIVVKILISNKTHHLWPNNPLAIFWGIIGSIMESAGLSLFFVGLGMHITDTGVFLILMNAIFIAPVIFQFILISLTLNEDEDELLQNEKRHRRKAHIQKSAVNGIAFIFLAVGISVTLKLIYDSNPDFKPIGIIPTAISLIGISWTPKMRQLQIDYDLVNMSSNIHLHQEPEHEANVDPVRRVRDENCGVDVATTSTDNINSNITAITQACTCSDNNCNNNSNKNAKTKAAALQDNSEKSTLINSIIKLLSIPVFVALTAYVFDTVDLSEIRLGYVFIKSNKTLFGMFVVHIVSSFVGYHVLLAGCLIARQRLCFAIPLTFATPVCIVIVLSRSCDTFGLEKCTTPLYDQYGISMILLYASIWFGQFLATAHYVWKSQDCNLPKGTSLFWVPTYDGALLEQNMLLNRKNE